MLSGRIEHGDLDFSALGDRPANPSDGPRVPSKPRPTIIRPVVSGGRVIVEVDVPQDVLDALDAEAEVFVRLVNREA